METAKAERIQRQVHRLSGASRLLGRREITELPNVLWDDEEILDLCQGFYSNGNGLLVATNRRLLFVDKGLLWGLKVEDFPLDKVSSVQYTTGLLFGTITIFTSGNKAEITQVEKAAARSFAEGVRARMSVKNAAPAVAAAASAPASARLDVVAEIERLGQLKERGLISDDEFAAGKRRVLGM